MAKFSIISKDAVLTRVNALPEQGASGVTYFVIPEGRVYRWEGGKYVSAAIYDGTPRYTGSYCKVSFLEFAEIASPAPIDWEVGDYVVYNRTGLTYRLYDIPQPKKRARNTEFGGSIVYSNVQFFPDTKLLEIEPFRDLVPDDEENIHFTTQASWSVWTNAANLIDRFNAVMNTAYPGKWEFRLVDVDEDDYPDLYKLLHDTWFDFTISGENVLQGLTKLYDLCGNIGWVHSVELDDDDNPVNIITIGIPPTYNPGIGSTTNVFKYGIGNGLTEIRKSTTNKNELKTRLFAYGSTRNMIPRHYNNLTPAIKDADSVYIPNLMLPLSKWGTTGGKKDASKAYIDNNVALYGLRPETVYFDGSNGRKEIYPSLEETTIGELYDVMASGATYRPNLSKHGRSVRLDEIESVSGIVDDGQRSTDGEKYYASMEIPIPTISISEIFDFQSVLVDGIAATHTGKMLLPLSNIPTLATTSSTVYYLNYYAIVTVAGRTYTTEKKTATPSASMAIVFSDINIDCNAGDDISITLAFETKTSQHLQISVTATTLTAGISWQKKSEFIIRIPQIGFDISTRARLGSQGLATISMKDGMCGGRSFIVKAVAYNSSADSWDLTLYRGLDESLDLLFPNTTYPISSGDHFVLLDIAMPDTYIGMAEQKLLSAATALLNDISVPKPFFEPLVDAKFMVDNNRTLLEGQYMQINDADITDGSEYVLVDTLVINEGESNIPTYKVTLREQKKVEYNNSQASNYQLTSLAGGTNSPTASGGLSPAQKEILTNLDSWFGKDANGNIFVKKDENGNDRNFYAFGEVTAGGVGSGGQGGGLASVYFNGVRADDGESAKFGIKVNGSWASILTDSEKGKYVDISTAAGSVTSVGLSVPTGFSVTGSPITSSGTLAIGFASGYSLPTTAKQTAWDNKQNAISDLATIRAGAALGATALQPSALLPYRTASAQDAIDAALEFSLATNIAAISGRVTSIEEWFASPQLDELLVKDLSVTHAINLNGYDITGVKAAAWDAHLTNTSNPHSVTWTQVKPSGGVPLADLASGVQTSLGKADTAYGWGDWRTRVGTLEGYFTDGSAKKALQLTTARNIWGQSFNGAADISGDMSSVGKMTFTAKTSAATSGNVLEVVTLNGVTYLHTTLPFYSDNEITAGGIGSGSGGGGLIETVYGYTDLGGTYSDSDKTNTFNAYTTAKLAQRITALENAPAGGVTSFNARTGAVSLTASDVNAVISYQAPISDLVTIRTRADEGHTAYGYFSNGKLPYTSVSGTPTALKNPTALSWSGYSSGSYDGSSAKSISIPNNTNQLTNGANFITASALAPYRTASAQDVIDSALELALSAGIASLDGRIKGIENWLTTPSLDNLLVGTLGVKDMINLCGYDITLGKVGEWDGKQDAISDLATIRSRADEGHTAYGWGNWATRMGNVESRATSLETRATTLEGYFSGGIAKKATADASGNVITTTYQTIANTNAAELALSIGVASVESRVASIEQWMRSMSADDLLVKMLNIVNMLNLGGVNIKVNASGEVEIAGNLRTIGNIVATGEITAGA